MLKFYFNSPKPLLVDYRLVAQWAYVKNFITEEEFNHYCRLSKEELLKNEGFISRVMNQYNNE